MTDVIDPKLSWSNLKAAFEAVDPEIYKHVPNPAETFKSLRDIDDWANAARNSFTNDINVNRSEWIAVEVDKIALERENLAPELKPPFHQKSHLTEARERVERRIEGVYQNIFRHGEAERKRVLSEPEYAKSRNPAQTIAHPVSKATHREVDKSWNTLSGEFEQFLQNAGIDHNAPAATAFRSKIDLQRREQHRDIERVFNAHDIERLPAQSQTNTGPSSS